MPSLNIINTSLISHTKQCFTIYRRWSICSV